MKKWMMALCLCVFCMLTGCSAEKEEIEKAVPTVQIAHGAYQYDHGYALAEGWVYDMTISAEKQMAELDALVKQVGFEPTGEDFLMDSGYRLIWRDAAGNVKRDMLILPGNQASMDGMLYRMSGAEGLVEWLDALKLDEQNVTE